MGESNLFVGLISSFFSGLIQMQRSVFEIRMGALLGLIKGADPNIPEVEDAKKRLAVMKSH